VTQAERIAEAVQAVALAEAVAMRYTEGEFAPGTPAPPDPAEARQKLVEALDAAFLHAGFGIGL